MNQTADNHIFKFLKNKFSRFLCNLSYFNSLLLVGNVFRSTDQHKPPQGFNRLWNTALSLQRGFQGLDINSFQLEQNSIQNTSHSRISLKLWGWSMFNSKFQNTPLSIQILLSVARLAHLPPTLLVLRLAGLPPLCPPRNLRPPPWHPSKVEPGAQIFSYGRSVHVGSQWWDAFPGAEWGPTSNHSEESEPFEEKRGGDNFLLRLQVSTSTKILVHPVDQGNKLGAMVTYEIDCSEGGGRREILYWSARSSCKPCLQARSMLPHRWTTLSTLSRVF